MQLSANQNDSIAMTEKTEGMVQPMKAITRAEYGSANLLKFEEIARPAIGDNDVLVRVHCASVSKGDVHLMTGKPYLIRLITGLRKPKSRQFGQNLAGKIVSIGKNVSAFKCGDSVFGQVGLAGGTFAEYVCVPETALATMPVNLDFGQAASIPDSATTALQGLRDLGKLQAGQKVLINGASGGVGTFAVQIAKAMGAHVTAVCSTRHVDTVGSIGADEVIDYTRHDFASSGKHYDVAGPGGESQPGRL